jgi:hypothetical protein
MESSLPRVAVYLKLYPVFKALAERARIGETVFSRDCYEAGLIARRK